MPLASNPGKSVGQTAPTHVAHYATPRDFAYATALGPNFMSATAARASTRGRPGSNAVRAVKWAHAWRLPANQRAYEVLSLKRVPERFAAIALQPLGEYSLFDKYRRAVMKTWSCLVQHEPALQDTPTTSWVSLGLHWAFPHNPLLCLEGSMHVLSNMMPIRPDADIPSEVIDTVVALVEHKRASLTAKWRRMRIEPSEIIAPLIKNLAVPIFGEALWPAVFGACCVGGDDSAISIAPSSVLEPSSSLLLFVSAIILLRAPLAEKATNRERVFGAHNALFQQDGGESVLRSVCHVMSKFVRDLIPQVILLGPTLPRRSMIDFIEDEEYYPPLLNPEDEPERLLRVSIPEFLTAIEKNEVELAKRGLARTKANENAAEGMAWSRALAVQEPNAQVELMARELARRQRENVKGFMMRNQHHADPYAVQQENQKQRLESGDTFVGDTRYVSPSVRSNPSQFNMNNNNNNNNQTTVFGEKLHYRPEITGDRRTPQYFDISPSRVSIMRGSGVNPHASSTIVQTSIPSVMNRSNSTRPPSSVAAVLQVQQSTHPYKNNNHHLLQTPSSSSGNPTGMVNSPPRPMPPPFLSASNKNNNNNRSNDDNNSLFPPRSFVQVSSIQPNNNNNNNNNNNTTAMAMKTPYNQQQQVSNNQNRSASASAYQRPTSVHRVAGQPNTISRNQQQQNNTGGNLSTSVKRRRPVSSGAKPVNFRNEDANLKNQYYPYSTTTGTPSSGDYYY